MRRSLLVVAVVLLAATACDEDARPGMARQHGAAAALQGHAFHSTQALVGGVPKPLEPGSQVTLFFDADLVLSGSAGCNHFGAKVSVDQGRIRLGEVVGMTTMDCVAELGAQDAWLLETLRAEPSWELRGRRLTISTPDTQIVLDDMPLAE